MERTRYRSIVTFTFLSLAVILVIAVIAGVIRFLRIALSALGNLAALPGGYSVGRSVFTVIAVGFLAMSLIQAVRAILPMRAWFHEDQVHRWCLKTEEAILIWKVQGRFLSQDEKGKARTQARKDVGGFLKLANSSDKVAFFNAPIEQVCGQLSAIGEFLLSEAPTKSVGSAESSEELEDRPIYLLTALAGPTGGVEAVQFLHSRVGQRPDKDKEADFRSRIGYHIQRNIDQLQISIAHRWQWGLRCAAMAVGFIIALTVITQEARSAPNACAAIGDCGLPDRLGLALVVGLTSGYLASVFRDVVAIIERLRRT